MTSAPCAEASRAASSCLSIIDSWSPDQSVCSNAALTVLDIAPSWGSCRALLAPVPPMLTTRRPERERALRRLVGHARVTFPRVRSGLPYPGIRTGTTAPLDGVGGGHGGRWNEGRRDLAGGGTRGRKDRRARGRAARLPVGRRGGKNEAPP